MKLTVFTYSEICLINYFHLEVVVGDSILAVILLFGQTVHFTGHAGKHKLIRKLINTSILTMHDILNAKNPIEQI